MQDQLRRLDDNTGFRIDLAGRGDSDPFDLVTGGEQKLGDHFNNGRHDRRAALGRGSWTLNAALDIAGAVHQCTRDLRRADVNSDSGLAHC